MYTKYYGLKSNPFENTPDPAFIFPSESHREVLASLGYGIDHAKGFILLSGDIGTGKTTMVNALLKEIDPSYIVLHITNPKWGFDDIIRYLALQLKIATENRENFQILEKLQSKLEKLDDQNKRVVLIVDEAHLLSEEILEDIRLLSNIEKNDRKLIQIVLVGQKEIYQKLRTDLLKTLKQRISINRHLRPLNKKETGLYIHHRLKIAGRRSPLFSKKAITRIWKRSRGVPRLINHLCDNALLIGYAADARFIRSREVNEVIDDINFGLKRIDFHRLLRFANLKWALAATAGVFLIVVITIYFTSDRQVSANNVSENKMVSVKRPAESVLKQIEDQKLQLSESKEDEKSVSPDSKKEGENEKLAAADLSDSIGRKSELFEEYKAEATKQISGEGPRELIPSMIEKIKDIKVTRVTPQVPQTAKVVKHYDNVSSMAKEVYGIANHTVIDLIHMANPQIRNVNNIFAGQIIYFPRIEKKDLIYKDEMGHYHIHYASFYDVEGAWECLQELRNKEQKSFIIAKKQQENKVYRVYFGDYQDLAEAERQVENLRLRYYAFIH